MTKVELQQAVAQQTGIKIQVIERVLESTINNIRTNVAQGETIYLRGFGTIGAKKRAAKIARNITANTPMQLPETTIPFFKPCDRFKKTVAKLK